MDIMNKKVLVFGSGISGIAASRLLEKKVRKSFSMMEMKHLIKKR